MLEKLDTLIAFAVVMLGVSLIITILTQIVSTALGLRGTNLLWGIETLLQELAPGLAGAGLTPRDLAQRILRDPMISDSTFSRAGNMWLVGPLVRYLSNLRGTRWFIERWRYATAIRAEELARMLQRIAPGLPPAQAAILTNLLQAPNEETVRRLTVLNNVVMPIIAPPPGGAAPPSYALQMDRVIQQAIDAARQPVGKLETWFASTMDRVSQRFVLQIRLWTILFAILLAFGLHFDSLHLLDQLFVNPGTRTALINLRDGMLSQAKSILPSAPGAASATEVPMSAAVLQEALDRLKKTNSNIPPALQIPAVVTTVQDAETWLAKHAAVAAGEYRRTVIAVLRDHVDEINQDLFNAGVDLIPRPYPGLFTFSSRRNVLGILLAAAFLSLGAPFWYNALKNLSSLRTVVATKEQKETAGA